MRTGYTNCCIKDQKNMAFLVEDGKILAIGSAQDARMQEALANADEHVDLHGLEVLPGKADGHVHLLQMGRNALSVDCSAGAADRLANAPRSQAWLYGVNWDGNSETLSRTVLDEAVKDRPAVVLSKDGQVMALNSAALHACAIDENTKVESGSIDAEKGIVRQTGVDLVRQAMPAPDTEEIKTWLLKGMELASAQGITAAGSEDFLSTNESYQDILTAYEQLSYQQKMKIRVSELVSFCQIEDFASFLDEGYSYDVGNDFFKIGALLLKLDDVSDKELRYDDATVQLYVQMANRFNTPVWFDAASSGGIDQALDVLKEEMYPDNPLQDAILVHRAPSAAQLARIQKAKIVLGISGFLPERASSLFYGSDQPFAPVLSYSSFLSGNTQKRLGFTGSLKEADPADFYVVDEGRVMMTVVNGEEVYRR
ncbi:MAG: amidohydrolase family protein [Lactimicrobium sp.]|jgi:predicted amidohydrolase YtcJ|uniref:amidohydrolase family protein n=1 Tax=Lactimicrobium sp. TaxID=2563780 RepID=UPI002F34F1B0